VAREGKDKGKAGNKVGKRCDKGMKKRVFTIKGKKEMEGSKGR
jgi:hypothetical protein